MNHLQKAHRHAVVWVIDPLDAVLHKLLDFLRRDRAAAAAKNANMRGAQLSKTVDHVTEKFHVAALVRTDRDAVGIFLNGRSHNVVHTAVVAQVDDFSALRLNEAPHDVDRGIVAVEQRCRGHEAQWCGVGFAGQARQLVCSRTHAKISLFSAENRRRLGLFLLLINNFWH